MPVKKETVIENSEAVQDGIKNSVPKVPRKFLPDDMIPCRSVTYGQLLLTGPKTNLLYTWSNYNDITEIPFQDLQALRAMRSSYLFRPRFIIEDPELVEQWNKDFKEMYDNIAYVDVEEILNLPIGKFKTALKKAPKGVQQVVKNIAGEKIMNGSLDSLAKIKAIDEILGTDLKLYLQ